MPFYSSLIFLVSFVRVSCRIFARGHTKVKDEVVHQTMKTYGEGGTFKLASKGKVLPITGHERPEGEQMYSSTLPSTSALDGVGGRHAPAALPPGKTRYPSYRRLGWPQGRSGRVRKISPPPTGIRSPDRPARSESLYRLSYPGPLNWWVVSLKPR